LFIHLAVVGSVASALMKRSAMGEAWGIANARPGPCADDCALDYAHKHLCTLDGKPVFTFAGFIARELGPDMWVIADSEEELALWEYKDGALIDNGA
jgi:hypothetical protein